MIQPHRIVILSFLMVMMPLGANASEAEAQQLLDRMIKAFRDLNYQGRFVYLNGSELATLSIAHAVDDGKEREKLMHLSGGTAEVLREDGKIMCVHQDNTATQLNHSVPAGPFAKAFERIMLDVDSHYQLVMQGADRVAGRSAHRIDVLPRDENRYGYHLWLDDKSGLLLKSVLVGENNTALEVFEFTSLEVGGEVPESALKPSRESAVIVHKQRPVKPADVGDRNWAVKWLPAGFQMTSSERRFVRPGNDPVAAMMYSDGLAAITVFVEKIDQAYGVEKNTQRGATAAVSKRLRKPHDEFIATVVGEIPPMTASRIATSVEYEAASQ